MSKRSKAIICNLLIVILEIIGLIVTLINSRRLTVEYYTLDSNILALVSSLILLIYLITNKKIPKWLKIFKYATTTCLAITFFVVLLILAPMYNFNYGYLFLHDSLLYQHLLCPILSIVTFLLFYDINDLSFKDNIKALFLTVVYGLVLIPLNIIGTIEGPYPFLMVRSQSVISSIVWLIVIYVIAYVMAYLLRVLNRKLNK